MNKDEPKLKEWVNNWVSTNQKTHAQYDLQEVPRPRFAGERDEG